MSLTEEADLYHQGRIAGLREACEEVELWLPLDEDEIRWKAAIPISSRNRRNPHDSRGEIVNRIPHADRPRSTPLPDAENMTCPACSASLAWRPARIPLMGEKQYYCRTCASPEELEAIHEGYA